MDGVRLPQKLYFSKSKLSNRVVISYILDYVIIIVLFFVFYALDAVEPFHQHFSLQNYTLQYPYAVHERVPLGLLFTLNTIIPIIIIAIYALAIDGLFSRQKRDAPRDGHRTLGRYRLKDRLWELNCGVLGLLLAQGAAFVITGALKNAAGKPRPDLIDRCQPLEGSVDPPVFGLSTSTICTQTDHKILKDGFRSFPSGHSSSAFAGLFYLSIYLAAKMHVLDNRGEVWKTFIVLIPTLGAALIAVSRIMDARHHPFDVISGSLLGILVAWAAYRQYFPPVTETWRKGRAYPIRTWGSGPKRPGFEEPDDQSAKPMRGGALVVDTQRSDMELPRADQRGNVFRQQVSRSRSLRQGDFGVHFGGSSTSSLNLENRRPSRALSSAPLPPRPVHSDSYWSSSSEHEPREDGFELQPRPLYLASANASQRDQGLPKQSAKSEGFNKDTLYHPSAEAQTEHGRDPVHLSPDVVRSPAHDAG